MMKLTRRENLAQLAGLAAATATPQWLGHRSEPIAADVVHIPSLRDAAAAVGLEYGSASDNWFRNEPPRYQQLFAEQCALYAPILSWQEVAPTPAVENDTYDPNTQVALDAGLRITGAHLLWYLRTPPWFETLPRDK